MATEKDIQQKIERKEKAIEEYKKDIEDLKQDLERLHQSDVLTVGTRVRVKKDYNTPENHERMPGWSPYLHFMNPYNPATIMSVDCCDGQIGYKIKFDDQTCTSSWPSLHNGEEIYQEEAYFYFKQENIEPIMAGELPEEIEKEPTVEQLHFNFIAEKLDDIQHKLNTLIEQRNDNDE